MRPASVQEIESIESDLSANSGVTPAPTECYAHRLSISDSQWGKTAWSQYAADNTELCGTSDSFSYIADTGSGWTYVSSGSSLDECSWIRTTLADAGALLDVVNDFVADGCLAESP